MQQLDTVLLKVASRCNLDCSYCYVYQGQDQTWKKQPKKIKIGTIDAIINSLLEVSKKQKEGFAIVLHGGEPLLIGTKLLEKILGKLRQTLSSVKYPISIQTNGILINKEILNICSLYKTSISVSIDGPKISNDIARFDHKGNSSFSRVINGIELLRDHEDSNFLFAGTLSVIQPETNPKDVYWFLKNEVRSPNMDFLLQDGNHDFFPYGKNNFESIEYGKWLAEVFFEYINDPEPPKIRLFDDLIKINFGGLPIKEGKGENNFGIIVIETDGEIRKNDTLRAAFEGVDFFEGRPNITNTCLTHILKLNEFINASKVQLPTSQVCLNCPILKVCGGGMPLSRWSQKNGFNNPSVYCRDHHYLISIINNVLLKYKS